MHNTLLCVLGLTPQVVTETLYCLATGTPSVVPERLKLITTTTGERAIERHLMGPSGQLARLRADLALPQTAFQLQQADIHVVQSTADEPLADIQSEADNNALADTVHRVIAQLCQDPDQTLHVSLAGGRKTMSFYAGYLLSLFARPQDRLYHVLVNAPFEAHPEFFFPPTRPALLTAHGNAEPLNTKDARLTLAQLPILKLRDYLPDTPFTGQNSLSSLVAETQRALDRPHLALDCDTRRVTLQGITIELSPTHFLWMLWAARRRQLQQPACPLDETAAIELLQTHHELEGSGPDPVRQSLEIALEELKHQPRSNYFERTRSRLNRALASKSGLPPNVASRYYLAAVGKRPNTRYGLTLDPAYIQIRDVG